MHNSTLCLSFGFAMNFFDYDLTRSETPPQAQQEQQPDPSLNEEVQQVVGQLGRLWGGFRKQVSCLPSSICPSITA